MAASDLNVADIVAAGGATADQLATGTGVAASTLVGSAAAQVNARTMSGGIANGLVTPPSDFAWNFTRYPINVYRRGPFDYATDLDPQSLMPSGFWNSPVYYVDTAKADDSLSGTTPATAKATIRGAITAAIAAGASGVIIMVKKGLYDRSRDLTKSTIGSGTLPEIPVALIGYGGRVDHGPVALLTWAADATYTSCYTSARSNVARVLDTSRQDDEGNYVELPAIADATTLNSAATEEGWLQNGANVLVKRKDGKAPSNTNTYVLLINSPSLQFGTQAAFISGISGIGGVTGTLQASDVSNTPIVAVDSSFAFSGTTVSTSATRAIYIDNKDAIAAFFRCKAGRVPTDAFNFHMASYLNAGVQPLHVLTVGCRGIYSGVTVNNNNQNSCNGWTLHENVRGIDLNGRYLTARGGSIADIDQTQAWLLGTISGDDLGDASFPSHAVRAGDTARIWAQELRVTGAITALHAASGTDPRIFARSCQDGGGLRLGNVTSY